MGQQEAAGAAAAATTATTAQTVESDQVAVSLLQQETEPASADKLGQKGSAARGNLQERPTVVKQQRRAASHSKYVLDPSGSLYYHWSVVVSFAFLYNFWSLSYRFAFQEIDFETVAFWFALDYSADLIYLLDVVINLHTGYLEDGVLQRQADKIGQHYRECTLFYLDCFCLLPLDILYLSIGFNSILRCTRLVKIYKFWSFVDRTERHTNYPNVFRTFTLVHYILVIFHWNACLFHMISKNKLIDIENLYKINDNQCDDILCQYLHAFYWSTLALTTIGDLPKPRTKGEYIYVTAELFFGLFLFASVLGHVANIVTNVSAARKEFQAKLDAVKTFMRMRRVSEDLQNKVVRWFDYLWISQKSSDEERSVACLPDRLKAEIAIHVHLDTLKRVDIFQNTEAGFLCELVLRLKPVLFSPGDYVCRKNEVGHEMYIVSRGILEVVTNEGQTVVATLKAGSYFGEISVLNVGHAGNKRTASVRSVGYSDLFCLNKQDLWDVLKNYPNAEARIRSRAEERLSKLDINQTSTANLKHQSNQNSSSAAYTTIGGDTVGTRRRLGSSSSSRVRGHHCSARMQELAAIGCSCHLLAARHQAARPVGCRLDAHTNWHHVPMDATTTANSDSCKVVNNSRTTEQRQLDELSNGQRQLRTGELEPQTTKPPRSCQRRTATNEHLSACASDKQLDVESSVEADSNEGQSGAADWSPDSHQRLACSAAQRPQELRLHKEARLSGSMELARQCKARQTVKPRRRRNRCDDCHACCPQAPCQSELAVDSGTQSLQYWYPVTAANNILQVPLIAAPTTPATPSPRPLLGYQMLTLAPPGAQSVSMTHLNVQSAGDRSRQLQPAAPVSPSHRGRFEFATQPTAGSSHCCAERTSQTIVESSRIEQQPADTMGALESGPTDQCQPTMAAPKEVSCQPARAAEQADKGDQPTAYGDEPPAGKLM